MPAIASPRRLSSPLAGVPRVPDCSYRRLVGVGPLQFFCPLQVWIASDDFVFVADMSNDRVQVPTPCLDFQGFRVVGVGQLDGPAGVCANADVVVVSQYLAHRISVFGRSDSAFLRRFGGDGSTTFPEWCVQYV
jgi:hypothetical protein